MILRRVFAPVFLLMSLLGGVVFGQSRFTISQNFVDELWVDFVVTEKQGQVASKLKLGEFYLEEKGRRLIEGRLTHGHLKRPGKVPVRVLGKKEFREYEPDFDLKFGRLVLFVFGKIRPELQESARQAAQAFVSERLPGHVSYSAVALGSKVVGTIPFSNDTALIRTALDQLSFNKQSVGMASAAFQSGMLLKTLETRIQPQTVSLEGDQKVFRTGYSEFGRGTLDAGINWKDLFYAQTLLSMIEKDYEPGSATTARMLQDICLQLGNHPGRKTVIFLDEGLSVDGPELLRTVEAANRNLVSIYGLDVRLLPQLLAGKTAPGRGDSLARNMSELASSTGAFPLMGNQRLVDTAKQLLTEVLTFGTVNCSNFDDTVGMGPRQIRFVLPAANHRNVRLRSSYYVSPASSKRLYFAFENRLARQIERGPRAGGIGIATSTFRLTGGYKPEFLLGLEVPTNELALQPSQAGDVHRMRFSYLAVLRDASRNTVDKWSIQMPVEVPNAKVAAVREGYVSFQEVIPLRPGKYLLEAAIFDQIGNRFGVSNQALEVKEHPTIGMSELSLVRRLDVEERGSRVLRHGSYRVIPWMTSRISRASMGSALLFLRVSDELSKRELKVRVRRNGQDVKVERINFEKVASLSDQSLLIQVEVKDWPPGEYQFEVSVAGDESIEQKTVSQSIKVQLY
jgi:hypothetical protein